MLLLPFLVLPSKSSGGGLSSSLATVPLKLGLSGGRELSRGRMAEQDLFPQLGLMQVLG